MKNIGIYLFDTRSRNYGLGEFEYCLAQGLSQRAEALSQEGLKLYFMVIEQMAGAFGSHVEYIILKKWQMKLANVFPLLYKLFRPVRLNTPISLPSDIL